MQTRSRVRHNEVSSPASLALRQVIHCSRMLLRRQSRLCKRFLVSGMICQKFRSLLPSREATRRRFQAFRFSVFPLSLDNDGAAALPRLGFALPLRLRCLSFRSPPVLSVSPLPRGRAVIISQEIRPLKRSPAAQAASHAKPTRAANVLSDTSIFPRAVSLLAAKYFNTRATPKHQPHFALDSSPQGRC